MKKTIAGLLTVLLFASWSHAQQPIRVGAKHFNEGYILSEMIALLLEDGGFMVERKFNLGGTTVAFEALRNGAIDVYPEYTGTLAAEILNAPALSDPAVIGETMQQRFGLKISRPYGFSNTYALVMRGDAARQLAVSKVSDLGAHPGLSVGLSHEFLKRKDGWQNLAKAYGLSFEPAGLEHGLAYQALLDGAIDVTDAYSTDGEIERYDLVLLQDNLNFFPAYRAVSLYSASLPGVAKQCLDKLAGAIDERAMQSMNAEALFSNRAHRDIAREFLTRKHLLGRAQNETTATGRQILSRAGDHVWLTLVSLVLALVLALPVAILLYRFPPLAKPVLYFTGVLQTIPSIALLALMIPLFGIGTVPAVVALFLYALLPILRNTIVGLDTVDPQLKKVARSLGMSAWQRLRFVELPLAVPGILTGIRTAAVINVGTATLAAFIGAGGLGEFIVTGLALNNTALILQGAIPAAIMAIAIELLFELIEWKLLPRHLRRS
jgi:osmoprotectant transport system permease protein